MRLPFFLCLLFLAASGAFAQDEDLSEAAGLDATASDPAPDAGETPKSPEAAARWRGYFLVDSRMRKFERRDNYVTNTPNAEASLALDVDASETLSFFGEGRGFYEDQSEEATGLFDQGGVRFRPIDSLLFVAGKERNRRSPGLILSPSDFVNSSESIPGARQERGGTWLMRASWQDQQYSLDLIALPVSESTDAGFIGPNSEYLGTALRYFQRLPGGVDIGVDVGMFDDDLKAGMFVQTIAAQVWKLYAESGYDDLSQGASYLLGVGYEGSSDYALRFEWFHQEDKWRRSSPLFTDATYLISSLSLIEIAQRFNVTDTFVRSLEAERYFNLLRTEWLINNRQVAGLTLIHVDPKQPFVWQAMVDWKVSL